MLQGVSRPFENLDLDERVIDVLTASWRSTTRKQYQVYWKKWTDFCKNKKISHLHPSVNSVLSFLSELFHNDKASYSTLNAARSALSSYVTLENSNHSVGSHPLVCRYLKGVFNLRPPRPRYKDTWDVSIALSLLRRWSPAKLLNLKQLTQKLCLLLALISAQRAQTLHLLKLDNIKLKQNSVTFTVDELLKQSRPGQHGCSFSFKAYPPDRRLCVVHYLKAYIKRTQVIRGQVHSLFISHTKPHKEVSSQTISRWIKEALSAAGIDTVKYKAHSTRAAAVSAASRANVPVSCILKQAGWSSEKTFQRFYHKPLTSVNNNDMFSQAVLNVRTDI